MIDSEITISTEEIDPELAQTVEVQPFTDFTEVRQGLVAAPTQEKARQGYRIVPLTCKWCGTQYDAIAGASCPSCHKAQDKAKQVDEVIRADQVEQILNTKLKWKCQYCSTMYDQPTKCCIHNYALANVQGKWQRALVCSVCKTSYSEHFAGICCNEGRMIPGKIMIKSQLTDQLLGAI